MGWDLEQAIVSAGFREMAKKAHPDKGGTTAQMSALNAARDRLKACIAYGEKSFAQAVPPYNDGRPPAGKERVHPPPSYLP